MIFQNLLYPVFTSNDIILNYGIKPFNISKEHPELWYNLKKIYMIVFIFSNIIYSNNIFNYFYAKHPKNKNNTKTKNQKQPLSKKTDLNLLIGHDISNNEDIYLPESGLYQNFLITGTIGSGKTSSAMYPFTRTIFKI